MALEHAILVALAERAGTGYELARRFDKSIGQFWTATHQQIYKVLARMESDGWLAVTHVACTNSVSPSASTGSAIGAPGRRTGPLTSPTPVEK